MDGVAGFNFPYAVEGGSGASVRGVDGVAIACGAVEGRVVAVGADFFGEDKTESVRDGEGEGGARRETRPRLMDDGFTGLLVGKHRDRRRMYHLRSAGRERELPVHREYGKASAELSHSKSTGSNGWAMNAPV